MMKSILAVVTIAVLSLVANNANASCTQVSGTGQGTDAVCLESPVGLCNNGTISGSINGSYVGAFQSLSPAPTLAQPLRLAFTSNSTMTTSSGTIYLHESGYLVLNDVLGALGCVVGCLTSGTPDVCLTGCVSTYGRTTFTQSMVPYAGAGTYASIDSGLINASGYGEYTSGVSYMSYAGEICD